MSPKMLAEFDQGSRAVSEAFPAFWWAMYSNLVGQGFSAEQAMDLLKTYIIALSKGS